MFVSYLYSISVLLFFVFLSFLLSLKDVSISFTLCKRITCLTRVIDQSHLLDYYTFICFRMKEGTL